MGLVAAAALVLAKRREPRVEECAEELLAEELPVKELRSEEQRAEEPLLEERSEEQRAEELLAEELPVEEPRAEEPRIKELCTEEPRAEGPRAEEPRTESPRAEEPRSEEPRAESPHEEELRPEEQRAEQRAEPTEPRAEELRAESPHAEEPRAEEQHAEQGADPAPRNLEGEALWQSAVSKLAQEAPAGAEVLLVPDDCPLQPGDEIVLGGDFNRVKRKGSIHLVARLRQALNARTPLYRLEVAPVRLAEAAEDGRTQAFIDEVEAFDPNVQPSTDEILRSVDLGPLPSEAADRKEKVLRYYTGDRLYAEVNKAMYQDSRPELRANASYIRELRDVFLCGQDCPIVEPYCGDVVRGAQLSREILDSYVGRLERGQTLYWPSFTSTSACSEVKQLYAQNVMFRVRCFKVGRKPVVGEYFPARISRFSEFPSEDEVLFPPHVNFRFVNILHSAEQTVIEMETAEYPCVWALISKERWGEFGTWAKANSEMVDCRQRQHSIICAAAKSISELPPDGPNPLELCVKCGANVNEVDPESKLSAVAVLARRHVEGGTAKLAEVMKSMVRLGASLYLKTEGSESASDILAAKGFTLDIGAPSPLNVKWWYWVDDGVDGKDTKWYPYTPAAVDVVEARFQQWLESERTRDFSRLSVQSGAFSYKVDFAAMQQANLATAKIRRIRRAAVDAPVAATVEG